MTLVSATNSQIDYDVFKRGGSDMCTVFQEIANEAELKGRAKEIIETGYEFDLSDSAILDRLQKRLDVTPQKAQEYFEMFGRQAIIQAKK